METQPADSYSVIYGVDTDGTLQIVPPAELLELIRTHKARAPVLAKFEADETVKAALEQFLIEISSRSENEEWHLRKDEEGRVLVSWDQDVIPVLEAAKLKDLEDCASSRDINHLVLLLVEAYGADGSKHRPSQTKLFDFLKQHVFYASHRLSILPDGQEQAAANIDCVADDKSIMLRVDKNTLWKISGDLSKDRITLQSSFDTTGFSRDCGRQALVDRCPATLLCPEAMGKDRARKLNGKRQPVFMGVGPKRERELLLLSPDTLPYIIHTQVKPDEWDKVVRANPEFSMPSYEEIQEMSDVTLFFSDVKIMSSSNIVSCGVGEGKVPFGKQTMDPIPVGVAFSSGVRLERQIFTDYHRVFENSKIDKGAEGAFKPEAYAELMRKRFEPVFRHRPAGKYWLTPVGLGVYSEAVPAADKEALMRSWIQGLLAAVEEAGLDKGQVFLPEWTQFTSRPLYNEWKARELQTCGNADEFAGEHGSSTIIIVCGDPVAYPGNEAMLGMMTASGDPFSFAYLAYLPTTGADQDEVARSKVGPYHAWCRQAGPRCRSGF